MPWTILELEVRFRGRWVVLDRALRVVDSGEDLAALRERHAAAARTFYFVTPASL